MSLAITPLKNIPLIRQSDDLADILVAGLDASNILLEDDDILILAQKIVSKAEGRMVNLATVTPGQRALKLAVESGKDPHIVELMLQESNEVLRVRTGTIIVEHRLGFVCANAGIDHSNVGSPLPGEGQSDGKMATNEEWVLLLPRDPDASSRAIREKVQVQNRQAYRCHDHRLAWSRLARRHGRCVHRLERHPCRGG